MEVVAAAAALGVVRPATTHTTAASKATVVVRASFKLGVEYVAVIVPMSMVALVHIAERLLPVKVAKPVTVITAAAVADAPVNPRVMEEVVEMTLLEKVIEAPITPEHTYADAVVSTLVVTATTLPAVAAPMVKPVTVTVTAVPASIG